MKIVFKKEKNCFSKIMVCTSYTIVCLLFVTVIISQITMTLDRKTVDADSDNIFSGGYVKLLIDYTENTDVKILCNGDEYEFYGKDVYIPVEDVMVIDVYNPSDDEVTVSVSETGGGAEAEGGKLPLVCTRGITRICRCVYNG